MKIQTHQIRKLWFAFFGLWLLLISGLFDFWIQSPGLKQWIQVEWLLKGKSQEIAAIEAKSESMKNAIHQLESNPIAQEREIRKVLGYLGDQEIVFEIIK